jgi:hypothetical protein
MFAVVGDEQDLRSVRDVHVPTRLVADGAEVGIIEALGLRRARGGRGLPGGARRCGARAEQR